MNENLKKPFNFCLSIMFVMITAPGMLFPLPIQAADEVDEMLALDFQDLVEVKITSVSKSEQSLFDAAAAVFVLTEEDIRRSSANTIPDLLRTVPGLHVGQSGSSNWAVSARGFQDRFANKMLVMVDGRSIYSIGFGGTYWEHLDLPLKDIARIEVIRGPGGSVWGANAVNGVINFITKNSADTTGWSMQAGGGNEEKAFGTARYGGAISESTHYRLYAKGSKFDEAPVEEGVPEQDEWYRNQGGFRIDSQLDGGDAFTIQGDGYHFDGDTATRTPDYSLAGQVGTDGAPIKIDDRETDGANILARYTLKASDKSEWVFQGYIDYFDSEFGLANETSYQYDLDVQHNYTWNDSIRTSYGVNTRVYDHEISARLVTVEPADDDFVFVDAFINNEFRLSDSVDLIVGTKIGHNDYTNVEAQPSARALWRASESQRIWVAVSRAVRVPDRQNNGVEYSSSFTPFNPDTGTPLITTLIGNDDLDAEVLWAYEMGYRVKPAESIFIDIALFYNQYDDIITFDSGMPVPVMDPIPALNVPVNQFNNGEVDIYGGEFVLTVEPFDSWKLIGTYSYLTADTDYPEATVAVIGGNSDESFVENMANLRSLWTISRRFDLDTTVRYVDSLSEIEVDDYVAVDVRLGWHLSDAVELSLVGQNIFDSEHREHVTGDVSPHVGIERSFFWRLDVEM